MSSWFESPGRERPGPVAPSRESAGADLSPVTVVCPVHNQRQRIEGLMVSLGRLAERGAEVIVVDDGSTDGSGRRLVQAARQYRSVHVEQRPRNEGPAAVRNWALQQATRDYIWFCDSDDEWEPDVLDVLLLRAQACQADVVVAGACIEHVGSGRAWFVDHVGSPIETDGLGATRLMLEGRWQGYLWDKLFRVGHVADLRFPALRTQSDFPFTFDALSSAVVVVSVERVLYRHLLRGGSLSQAHSIHEGLDYCWKHADAAIADRWPSAISVAERRYFKTWFYLAASSGSIWRSDLPTPSKREALGELARHASARDLPAALRRSWTTAARVLLLVSLRGRSDAVAKQARRVRGLW